jgi:hypothetical protein
MVCKKSTMLVLVHIKVVMQLNEIVNTLESHIVRFSPLSLFLFFLLLSIFNSYNMTISHIFFFFKLFCDDNVVVL